MSKYKVFQKHYALITMLTMFAALITFTTSAYAQVLTWPTDSQRITSPMGCRSAPIDPVTGAAGSTTHLGVDIGGATAGVTGDSVSSAATGTVISSGAAGAAGNMIIIESENGMQTMFMHMEDLSVSAGQTVSAGQSIGTMGNTGTSTAAHLDYRVRLPDGSGGWDYIDPVAAQGLDLSDPAVLAQLLAEGGEIANCNNMGATEVTGALGGSEGGESCDAEILSTGAQLAESHMNIEKQMVDEALSKPQSVIELSCFDQFGEMFSQEVAGIFGNTDGDLISGLGLDVFGFDEIFGDVQQNINDQISSTINNGLLGGRGATIGESVSTLVSDTFSSVMGGGGSGDVSFGCEAMNMLWEILQCENILDFQIPSLGDLVGDLGIGDMLSGLRPDSCAGEALYDAALGAADRVFTSHGGDLPQALMPSTLEANLSSY